MIQKTRVKSIFKWSIRVGIVFILLVFISIWWSDRLVSNNAKGKLYTSTDDIPHQKVGLLLGTGKYLTNGQTNLFYVFRIKAAVRLFKAGKIDYILVSGDNSKKGYDEPTTIQEDLIRYGIPKNRIYLDYAGFRTLDSVVRCKQIFGQTNITIISQQFHNERAMYIAERKGIHAIGYNAKDVGGRGGFRVKMREKLARVKLMMDLIFGTQPKFLGEKISIPVN